MIAENKRREPRLERAELADQLARAHELAVALEREIDKINDRDRLPPMLANLAQSTAQATASITESIAIEMSSLLTGFDEIDFKTALDEIDIVEAIALRLRRELNKLRLLAVHTGYQSGLDDPEAPPGMLVPRIEIAEPLRRLGVSMTELAEEVGSIGREQNQDESAGAAQKAMVQFSIGQISFKTQIVHILISSAVINVTSVAIAVRSVLTTTGDFIATVIDRNARVSPWLRAAGERLKPTATKAAQALKRVVSRGLSWFKSSQAGLVARRDEAISAEQEALSSGMPDGWDDQRIAESMLNNIEIPEAVSFSVRKLDLSGFSLISDIDAIAAFENLTHLNLRRTEVTDLSPLSNLSRLQYLYLRSTSVRDLSPIANCVALRSINFMNTSVTDLRPLAQLINLENIEMMMTGVKDLIPLSNLKKLTAIDARDTQISSLEALSSISSLETLDLRDTSVEDLGPLASLHRLQSVDIRDTDVRDISPLLSLPNLRVIIVDKGRFEITRPLGRLIEIRNEGTSWDIIRLGEA